MAAAAFQPSLLQTPLSVSSSAHHEHAGIPESAMSVTSSRSQCRCPSLKKALTSCCREASQLDTQDRLLRMRPANSWQTSGCKLRRSDISDGHRSCRSALGGAGVADERDREQASDFQPVASGTMMVPYMKKGYGAYGGGATLEKTKLDLSTSQTKTTPQIDLGGGGRGNNNRNVNGGGGDGDDGDGDDDDYFGEGDDEGDDDGGIFRKSIVIELFDRATMEAVLQEWFKTMADLPSGLRRAMELGLMSSAQLVRFMSVNVRPSIARSVARLTPESMSRAFIGRMIADPAFVYKFAVEQLLTIGSGIRWEVQHRGERLKDEWDLAAVNVLTLAACNAAVVWSLSPSRSYGTTASSEWQMTLQKLPNHVFDKSYPLREFNMPSRVAAFVYKAAELSLIGSVAGAVGGGISNALVKLRKPRASDSSPFRPSVKVPVISTSALAMGAFLGLSGNLRYQALYGVDRWMSQHVNYMSLIIFATTALRSLNQRLGEPTRLTWLGLDAAALSTDKAYRPQSAFRRPSIRRSRFTPPDFSSPSAFLDSMKKNFSFSFSSPAASKWSARRVTSKEESVATPPTPAQKAKKSKKAKRKVVAG